MSGSGPMGRKPGQSMGQQKAEVFVKRPRTGAQRQNMELPTEEAFWRRGRWSQSWAAGEDSRAQGASGAPQALGASLRGGFKALLGTSCRCPRQCSWLLCAWGQMEPRLGGWSLPFLRVVGPGS